MPAIGYSGERHLATAWSWPEISTMEDLITAMAGRWRVTSTRRVGELEFVVLMWLKDEGVSRRVVIWR